MIQKVREVQKNSNNQDLYIADNINFFPKKQITLDYFYTFHLVITNRWIDVRLNSCILKKYTPLERIVVLYEMSDFPISKKRSVITSIR